MTSIAEIDQESLIVTELAHRELRQDLMIALMLISNKKQSFSNLDQYEATKKLLLELFESEQTEITMTDKVR